MLMTHKPSTQARHKHSTGAVEQGTGAVEHKPALKPGHRPLKQASGAVEHKTRAQALSSIRQALKPSKGLSNINQARNLKPGASQARQGINQGTGLSDINQAPLNTAHAPGAVEHKTSPLNQATGPQQHTTGPLKPGTRPRGCRMLSSIRPANTC